MSKKKVKKNFGDILIEGLKELEGVKVSKDKFGDNSGHWIEAERNGIHITFAFDKKYETLLSIDVSKDVVQVVDCPIIARI